ncbi:MAG: glycosyltransferase family 4 protein [Deltaproteobacteria bacterium]|nr:glycosyltransferase family 4 protein [Deltaproteobacteria bacterium]
MNHPSHRSTNDRDYSILGLFPFDVLPGIGGIETSGRLAWQSVVNFWNGSRKLLSADIFCYSKRRIGGKPQTLDGDGDREFQSMAGDALHAASPLAAVFAAIKWRRRANLVLVWHCGLLKLVPFFRNRNAKLALFLHGIEAWRPQDWFTALLLRRVDLFLVNSEYAWQRFISFNPCLANSQHETVHLGIGMIVNGQIRPPTDPPAALMISRLQRSEDYKGHREMIYNWPMVLERIPEAELWIAGDGDLREDLEKVVRSRGLAGRIRFFGAVSEEQKQELLSRCRCLAMPSRGEGFGLVYLEAMRVARPCLVSTRDAGREVVAPPEAGLAADPADSRSLTDAICRLLSPGPEWERLSVGARHRYDNYFTASHFRDRLMSALGRIIV